MERQSPILGLPVSISQKPCSGRWDETKVYILIYIPAASFQLNTFLPTETSKQILSSPRMRIEARGRTGHCCLPSTRGSKTAAFARPPSSPATAAHHAPTQIRNKGHCLVPPATRLQTRDARLVLIADVMSHLALLQTRYIMSDGSSICDVYPRKRFDDISESQLRYSMLDTVAT